jgi:predicted acylesterase/phospholipase RssA
VFAVFALLVASCGPARTPHVTAKPAAAPKTTCVVLSVGGAKGLAHIGAMEALRDEGVAVDCVFGNSMGALVGGLYASDPKADLAERYRGLLRGYERELRASAGIGTFLNALGTYLLSAGGMMGSGSGLIFARNLSLETFRSSYSEYSGAVAIQDLPVRFGTSYQQVNGDGLTLVTPREGTLAAAVSASIANPYLFYDVDLQTGPLDPGADRVASVPVEDAYSTFLPERLVVINVTGEPALYSQRVRAIVDEVLVEACPAQPDPAMRGTGPEFERIRRAGYEQTRAALARFRAGEPPAVRGYMGAVIVAPAMGPGVEVVSVFAGSPAEASGLEAGDLILAIDGNAVACTQDLTRTFGALAPGSSATLIVARGAEERLEIPVVAAAHPVQLLH